MSKPNKGKLQQSRTGRRNVLDVRRIQDGVSGLLEEVMQDFELVIRVHSRNQVSAMLHEKNPKPGCSPITIPLEEALRANAASGFAKRTEKSVKHDATEERLKKAYFNLKDDVKVKNVINPKVKMERLSTRYEVAKKNEAALKQASDSIPEDVKYSSFFAELVERAAKYSEEEFKTLFANEAFDEEAKLISHGIPKSMRSKLLTGGLEVKPGSTFWTSLVGKSMQKFCPLTWKEVAEMPSDLLKIFNVNMKTQAIAALLKARCNTEADERLRQATLRTELPIKPLIGVKSVLARRKKTKERPLFRGIQNSHRPMIDEEVNRILSEDLLYPPADPTKVAAFWHKLAGRELIAPGLSRKDYLEQTLEILESVVEPKEEAKIFRGKVFPIIGKTSSQEIFEKDPAYVLQGKDSVPNQEYLGFDCKNINPKATVKQRLAKQKKRFGRKSVLTKTSRRWINGLRNNNFPENVIKEATLLAESFMHIQLQEIVAKTIYLTCQIEDETVIGRSLGLTAFEVAQDREELEDQNAEDEKDDISEHSDTEELPAPYDENGETQ